MAKDFAQSFYNSTAWKQCREAYKKKQCYICERCGEPGDIVHHKTRITPANVDDASITLNFENLELLCRDCHAAEHSNQTERRYSFDRITGEIFLL